MAKRPETRDDVRQRLVSVATEMLVEQGAAGVTTRGVAAAASVQAPTIYRLFGDKDGLLDAVVERVASDFVAAKAAAARAEAERGDDPLEDLRSAFLDQVDFGVSHPEVFRLLGDPRRVLRPGPAQAGRDVLRARVHRVALGGLLCVPEEHCVDLVQSAGTGVIQTLLATPPDERDPGLAHAMWDALRPVIALGGDEREAEHSAAATLVAFRALAPGLAGLSVAERALLAEWLDRPEVAPRD